MKPPFAVIPLAGQLACHPQGVVRIIDAAGENVTVMPARPASQLIALVNTIPMLTDALEHVAVEMFRTAIPDLCEMACAVEGIVQIVNPAFRLASEPVIDEESAIYAQALKACDCPPATVAGVEGASGWQSR